MCFLTTGPLHKGIRDLRRVFQAIRLQAFLRGSVLSRINQGRRRTLSLPRSFALLRWLWWPLWGFWIQAQSPLQVNSGLSSSACALIAPESTTSVLSSGLFEDGVGNDPNFWRRVECGLVLFFQLVTTFGHFPRVSAGASLLFQGFLLGSVLKFRSIRATLMKFWMLNNTLPPTLFSRFCTWRNVPFEKCTLRFGPKDFVHFRKIELDFGGSTSWNTLPNCSEFFNMAQEPDRFHAPHNIIWKTSWRMHVVREAADKNTSNNKAWPFVARHLVGKVKSCSTKRKSAMDDWKTEARQC